MMTNRQVYNDYSKISLYIMIILVLTALVVEVVIVSYSNDVDNEAKPKKVMPRAADDVFIPIIVPGGNISVF